MTSPFGKYKYIKVPFGLVQAPADFQELMKGVLKDFTFAIAYLDESTLATSNKYLKVEECTLINEA